MDSSIVFHDLIFIEVSELDDIVLFMIGSFVSRLIPIHILSTFNFDAFDSWAFQQRLLIDGLYAKFMDCDN